MTKIANPYFYIVKESLRYKSAEAAVEELLKNNVYTYRALKAYIILDDTFWPTYDKRKLKWARRYLRKHNIKFRDIKQHFDNSWEQDQKVYSEISKAFVKACPGAASFINTYS